MKKMIIRHCDDGNGKRESHECYVDLELSEELPTLHIHGYGETDEEAYYDMVVQWEHCLQEIEDSLNLIRDSDFIDVKTWNTDAEYYEVDCAGSIM